MPETQESKKVLNLERAAEMWEATKDYVATHAAQPEVTSGTEDEAAWLTRETAAGFPCGGRATVKAIKGKTVKWNQLVSLPYYSSAGTYAGVPVTVGTDGTITASGTSSAGGNFYFIRPFNLVSGHKYLMGGFTKLGASTVSVYLSVYDNENSEIVIRQTTNNPSIFTATKTSEDARFYLNISGSGATVDFVGRPQLFDLTLMFGAGNEPSTVAEFEALYPEAYYPYSAPTLQSAKPTGIESVGFNLWDEVWEVGGISSSTGQNAADSSIIRSTDYIPVFPSTAYYAAIPGAVSAIYAFVYWYRADKSFIGVVNTATSRMVTSPSDARYMRFRMSGSYGTTYKNDLCINLGSPRNGEYEPHWSQSVSIPIDQIAPNGLKSAGSAYDELRAGELVTRVGEFTFNGTTPTPWISSTDGDYVVFGLTTTNTGHGIESAQATTTYALSTLKTIPFGICTTGTADRVYFTLSENETTKEQAAAYLAQHPITAHIALTNSTTTPIDPPLNLTYRCEAGGTETVTHTEATSAPTLDVVYEIDGTAAVASIAPLEGRIASTNYSLGSLLMLGGTLVKVTTAIATGEAIILGQNVAATTVAAELAALA